MKIVNVNKFYYLRGGVERYFFELAQLLTQHGHKVIPFAMQHPQNIATEYSRYFPSYVEFGQAQSEKDVLKFPITNTQFPNKFKILSRMFWSFESARKFDQLLTDTKPDLVHVHNIYHHLSPSILPIAKRHHIPVVMTVHDYKLVWPHHLLYGYPTSPQPSPLRRGSYWNVVRARATQGSYLKSALTVLESYLHDWMGVYKKNIDLFLAPRAFIKDMMIAAGYDAKKIRVLPHFIKFEARNSKSETPHQSLRVGMGQANSKPTILFFGRLSKEKGVDILLKMMQDMESDVELRIIGTGPEEENLKLKAQSQKLRNVTFLGYVDDATLADAIDRATLVVFPSLFPETFGFTIIEALVHGKAVVASRIGAVPELIEDGKTGLLAEPGNVEDFRQKVEYLLSHDDERHAMERRAPSVVKQYTPEEHYKQLIRYYNEIIRLSSNSIPPPRGLRL